VLHDRLTAAGLKPEVLPTGTGVMCDVGDGDRVIGLRADIDALPITDSKQVSYASRSPGISHACGHDVHTAVVLGAGLVLGDLAKADELPARVRLIFQPAEESARSGAHAVIDAGGLEDVDRIYAVHCDPRTPVGQVGLRSGPITASADQLRVRLSGLGGHTARPHLTQDVIYALGRVVTELPGALSRRVDPRASLSVVWGRIAAGQAANAIPETGDVEGTLRCLDPGVWAETPALVEELVHAIVSPYGVQVDIDYVRNVPPVDNEESSVDLLAAAVSLTEGPEALTGTEQSLGGEDFAWYLDHVPGSMGRLGTMRDGAKVDLHAGSFDVDERAIGIGVRLLVQTALDALDHYAG
jgi:amidohydrolase